MPLASARSRLVNFRLTDEEIENLKMACLIQGARNVSDFARSAVLRSIEAQLHPERQLQDRFGAMEARMTGFDTTLRHVEELLRAVLKSAVQKEAQREAKGAP